MPTRKSPLRILITPNYHAPYDQRMVDGLADGFHVMGHQAYALPAPIPAIEVARRCRELSIDVVIQVNRTRHQDTPLPSNVRYISWFQDVFPETAVGFAESFRDSDILYALGDPEVLGLDARPPCYVGSLVCGVDQTIFDYPQGRTPCSMVDFSLCGFIPPPPFIARSAQPDILDLIRHHPLRGMPRIPRLIYRAARRYLQSHYVPHTALIAMMDTVLGNYRPLRGELDIHQLALLMRRNAAPHAGVSLDDGGLQPDLSSARSKPYASHLFGLDDLLKKLLKHKGAPSGSRSPSPFERSISYFARDYPRLLDRAALIREILQVSDALELYGPGWDTHEEFRRYAKGVINTRDGLLDVYCRSRINLANNTHGLGLHSRTLECMAVGGFIFMHRSPHDTRPGGMLTSFEPGIHYGAFTPENLREEARRWIKEGTKRKQVGRQAAEVVRQQHCWRHRARQILDDLGK